jgi:basic membrane protein A
VGIFALVFVFALIAAACGGDDGDTTDNGGNTGDGGATSEAPPAEAFKIAVVAPSAANDLAFTQSVVDALDRIKAEDASIEIAISDGLFVVEDAAAAIRDYADQGYDLVIAHGSQYGGNVEEIAPDFPETSFAWGTAADTFGLPNVYSYTVASDQGGFVQGQVAAALSTEKNIGVVGPIEVGDAKLYVDGFVNGVKAESPDATVNVNYIGSFSDVGLASEAAQTFVSGGADVLTGTAQMVVGAVGVADANGALWFGTQSNQTSLAPEIVVSSQVYHWEVVLQEIIDQVRAGTLGGEAYEINLGNDGLAIEFNEGYAVPDEVMQMADELIAGLKDGSIDTGASEG